ncbi:CoA-acylating methylmalonate-semialdehyde dehydrogenase [Halomarina halobia]|uniref:methylmalonate-semialdehyde dehydrogenase (CoA acylating) n=1 Tax=Halomarina halobia TaxID=3033386 RepID=A0ABD6AEI4_9EURY|nr:CoA-acylating methylmalonate-semialdehyde dehydrogenase [Halomarina sp. PSR21]
MAESRSRSKSGEIQNHVGGRWKAPTGESGQDVVNPATGERLAYTQFSSVADVDEAVTEGRKAFEEWRSTPVVERIQPMFELKGLLEENLEELTEFLVRDHGKTRTEARGELRRGIENVEVACGIPTMLQSGSLLNAAPGIDESAVRKPLGVFAAITPFNFPGMIPLWFLPYAVATGNCFVLKPSEKVPLVASRLVELIGETSLPDGVVQLVNGGPETVTALLEHEGIAGISFVGSTPVARHVYETAAKNGKRVQAQGGAKNYLIVTETADIQFAAEQTLSSCFACGGERCLATDIAVVEESVYDEFAEELLAQARQLTVGYGLEDGVDIGALIAPDHVDAVREFIATGISEGAELLLDGRGLSVEGYEEGNFLGPTVFGDVGPETVLAQEEIFGPVLGLMPAADIDEAIEFLNGTRFGNAASLFTGSGADARTFRHQADIGNLGINVGTAAPMAFFHFGGRKNSFFGDLHAQGEDMIHFYTDKSIYIERWPDA